MNDEEFLKLIKELERKNITLDNLGEGFLEYLQNLTSKNLKEIEEMRKTVKKEEKSKKGIYKININKTSTDVKGLV